MAVALGSGLMMGVQSMFFTVIGRAIETTQASLLLNVSGGILAGAIWLPAIGMQGHEHWNIPRSALVSATISVEMGMLIILGISFSYQQMGIAAGVATLFLGQIPVGVIVDALGGAGGDAIPLDARRIIYSIDHHDRGCCPARGAPVIVQKIRKEISRCCCKISRP